MTRRTHLVLLALAAVFVGFAAGRPLFLPALKLLFADWTRNLAQYSDAERAGAAWNFSLGLSLLSVMIPLSAMVTERFAARARYSHALTKSLLVGTLAFGAALLYQLKHFAAREDLAVKMPQLIGHQTTQLPENPLAKIVWFTAVCLVIFGPLDLWIARLQRRWRKEPAGIPPQRTES
jgi:MFS family permease